MIRRCQNPKDAAYAYYGERGIKVCERWMEPNGQGFLNFVADMRGHPGRRMTLDRINNDGDYEPGNCRWATRRQQSWNTRKTNWVTINGKRDSVPKWCQCYGISKATVNSRLFRGWDMVRAITTPSKETVMVQWNGQQRPAWEVGREHGLEPWLVSGRIKLGWPAIEAATRPVGHRDPARIRQGLRYKFRGMEKPLKEWSVELGINLSTLYVRAKIGLTGNALFAPSRLKRANGSGRRRKPHS